MQPPVALSPPDLRIYNEELAGFIPDRIVDIHTHAWLAEHRTAGLEGEKRTVGWVDAVASSNSADDLFESYRILLPGKEVTPLVFSLIEPGDDFDLLNGYVHRESEARGFPALLFTSPLWNAAELTERVTGGGYRGIKPYLTHAPAALGRDDITIFDFLPRDHLEAADRGGWIVILHIPRDRRLADPVNLAQLREIDERYPRARVVVAHAGRAYCNEDAGDAFTELAETRNILFDTSANTNQWIFARLIETVGPDRVLFGSDLPFVRMRMRRVCEDGVYVNLVPPGLYPGARSDPHLREVSPSEARELSWFLYEEILALKRAAAETGLARADIEAIFRENGLRILGASGKTT